jgi:hypothetical protein
LRAISANTGYSIQLFEGTERAAQDPQTGMMYTIQGDKPVVANFEHSGLHPWEVEAALEHFVSTFHGMAEGVNPLTKIAVYDTEVRALSEGWAPEFQKRVEDRLRKLGETRSEFIIVEKPAAAKPWPTYDDDSPEDIMGVAARLGISHETIFLYEVENANRPELVEHFRTADEEPAVEVLA